MGRFFRDETTPEMHAGVTWAASWAARTKCGTRADAYPLPNNPYDAARTPGASSSGDAAAVASGLSAIASAAIPVAACAFPPIAAVSRH